MGKTRLLDEALRSVPAPDRVARLSCLEHLRVAPFAPWIDVLHAVFGVTPDEPRDERTRKVRAYLRDRLPAWTDFGSLLNPVLDVNLPQSDVVRSLEARPRREKLVELVRERLDERDAIRLVRRHRRGRPLDRRQFTRAG